MGILNGIKQIGEYYANYDLQTAGLEGLNDYLELPMSLVEAAGMDKDRQPHVIRIALAVENPDADPLTVTGIEDITLAEYPGISSTFPTSQQACEIKQKYLYKAPSGSNVTWSFCPLYKMGKGSAEKAQVELVGEKFEERSDNWWTDDKYKQTRFFKINKTVIKGFEESGAFSESSAEIIMHALIEQLPKLTELWQDKKRSYYLLFGLKDGPDFIFPGEVKAFRNHFRRKLTNNNDKKNDKTVQTRCVVCQQETTENKTLDEIFRFSTFDKTSFLPAWDNNNLWKVFPLCDDCFLSINRGKTEVYDRHTIRLGIPNVDLKVIPEVIGADNLHHQIVHTLDTYFEKGLQKETVLFDLIASMERGLVFHFMFTERNQKQIILHRLLEDIPPSHFNKLKTLWIDVYNRFYNRDNYLPSLDSALKQIIANILNLAGKTDGEKIVTKTLALNVISALFNNERINVSAVKRLAAARLPALFADENWINKKGYPGSANLYRLLVIFEFFNSYNQSIGKEEE